MDCAKGHPKQQLEDWHRPRGVQGMLEAQPTELIRMIDALMETAGLTVCDRSAEAELAAVRAFHHQHLLAMRAQPCHAADAFSKGILCMVAKHLHRMVCLLFWV